MTDPKYRWILLGNVLIATFFVVLSSLVTIIGSTSIRGELGLSEDEAVWLTTLYLLGINTVVPSATWFADRFGYKKIYAIGLFVFALASLCAGLATGFWGVALARLLEGVGGGLVFPVGLAIAVQNFPKEKLPLALILYMATTFGGGFAIGMPLVGYVTQFYSWRFILDGVALLSLLTLFFWQITAQETELQKKGKFDTFGYLFFVFFIASLLIGLTYGPLDSTDAGWRSPWILGCFFVAGISLFLTVWIERRHKNPIIPLNIFKDPIFAVSAAAMFLLGMSIFASIETTMQYMIEALKYEKFVSSQIGMIYGISIGLSSILASILLKFLPASTMTFLGIALLTASYFLNTELSFLTGPSQLFWILLLRGMGVGFALGPTTVLAMEKVPIALRNQAATLLTFFRQVGGTYGGALLAILVIKRQIFHSARFAETVSEWIPGYRVTYKKIFSHFYSDLSNQGLIESAAQSKAAIIRTIELQALITAENDAMIIFGYVTLTVGLILLGLTIQRWYGKKDLGYPHPFRRVARTVEKYPE